jgi:mRNA degradation ribonuclease J1/J2
MSEPFSEEDLEDDALHNWIDHFGMKFYQLHASGHLSGKQVASLIHTIKPKKVFPIHTENQHLFKRFAPQTQMVEHGKAYTLH